MAQSRTQTRMLTRGVIKALGFAGAASVVLVAPNTTVLIDKYMKLLDKKAARKTIAYLKYRKLIEVKEKDGQLLYKLTTKGKDKFEKLIIEELEIQIPKSWDHKWRVVMFDIPTKHKLKRQDLLASLRKMDFHMLQQSVWLHPFDCEKQIGVLLEYLELQSYVSFLVVEKGNFTDYTTKHFIKIGLLA